MPGSKRSRSRDPSHPSKRIQTRRSSRLQGLPLTPDDALSADSAAPSRSPAEEKVPAGPSNPGVVRNRDNSALSRLPPDSDVLDAFAQLIKDFNLLSNEEAFMKFLRTYEVSMAAVCRVSSNVCPTLLHHNLFA